MSKLGKKLGVCPNCNCALEPNFEFCPQCGQENHDIKVPVSHLGYEFIEGFTHFDTKVFHFLKTMFTKPGQITKDYLDGKRARYVPPPRYYIFISVIYFLLLGIFLKSKIVDELNKNHDLVDHVTIKSGTIKYTLTPSEWLNWLSMGKIQSDSFLVANSNPLSHDYVSMRQQVYQSLQSYSTKEKKPIKGISFDTKKPDSDIIKIESNLGISREQLDSIYCSNPTKVIKVPNQGINIFDNEYSVKELEMMQDATDEQLDSIIIKGGDEPNFIHRNFLRRAKKYNELELGGILPLAVKGFSLSMFLLMPLIAFLTWLFFRKERKYYVEHLIFSIHMHSVVFTIYSIAITLALIFDHEWVRYVFFLTILGLIYYFLKSMKVVFGESRIKTILKFCFISCIYFMLSSLFGILAILYGALSF